VTKWKLFKNLKEKKNQSRTVNPRKSFYYRRMRNYKKFTLTKLLKLTLFCIEQVTRLPATVVVLTEPLDNTST